MGPDRLELGRYNRRGYAKFGETCGVGQLRLGGSEAGESSDTYCDSASTSASFLDTGRADGAAWRRHFHAGAFLALEP